MKKCPKCGNFSVDLDSYKGAYVCMIDGCSCVLIDENSYSFLKHDPSTKTVNRVKVEGGHETNIIKKYTLV
jgi:hypothetical protein